MSSVSNLMTHRLRKLAASGEQASEETLIAMQNLLELERRDKVAQRDGAVAESVILLRKNGSRLNVI